MTPEQRKIHNQRPDVKARRAVVRAEYRKRENELARATYIITAEANRAKSRAWRKANPTRLRATCRAWQQANKARCAEYQAIRRAGNRADPGLAEFYEWAKRVSLCLGLSHEVDHVIPLRGKTVSGLHVAANLRIIPKTINRRKSNVMVQS